MGAGRRPLCPIVAQLIGVLTWAGPSEVEPGSLYVQSLPVLGRSGEGWPATPHGDQPPSEELRTVTLSWSVCHDDL